MNKHLMIFILTLFIVIMVGVAIGCVPSSPSPAPVTPTQSAPSTPSIVQTKPESIPMQPTIQQATIDSSAKLVINTATNRASYKSNRAEISGFFYKPQGNGAFPGVLILHSSNGLTEFERLYTSWLASQGYVALAPDYFTPIGITSQNSTHHSFKTLLIW